MQLKIVVVWIALGFASLVQVAKQHVEVERGEHEVITYGNFKEFLNHTLNVSQVLASIYVKDFVECAFRCITTMTCFSFNIAHVSSINPNNHVCHLMATDKYNHSSNFVPSQEFHHYAIASPCESYPCQNNGKCRALYKENNYVCDCREGFMGHHCGKVIPNSCNDVPQATGIHKILNYGLDPFSVYCDQTNDGGVLPSVATPTVSTQSSTSPSPTSWPTCFQGSCYELFTAAPQTWENAKAFCVTKHDAQLVKIDSSGENNFIKSQFLTSQVDYWIGLSDSINEGVWIWTDGAGLGFTNWAIGQPSNHSNQHCAGIRHGTFYSKIHDAQWHDAVCWETKGYICEK